MRLSWIVVIVCMPLAAICVAQTATTTAPVIVNPNSAGIVVGPETTVFTEPILPDGSVDYVTAVNAVESRGVTSANNAACVLMRLDLSEARQLADIQRRVRILRLIGVKKWPDDRVSVRGWRGFQYPLATDNPNDPGYVDRFARAKTQPWSIEEMPELAAWIKTNEPALAIAEEAAARPRFWFPIVLARGDSLNAVHGLDSFLFATLRDALCMRSMLKVHNGDVTGALADILVLRKLGALLAQSPDALDFLAGISLQEAACRAASAVLQNSKPPSEEPRKWSAQMAAVESIAVLPRQVYQRARYEFLFAIQQIAGQQADAPLKFNVDKMLPDWNRILRLGNSYYDAATKDRSQFPAEQRSAEEKAVSDREAQFQKIFDASDSDKVDDAPKWLFPQNGETRDAYSDRVGATILVMMMPSFSKLAESARRCNERVDWLSKVGTALAIYRNENGNYPEKLDALIPKYLAQLPASTSKNPVGYERKGEGYVIRNVKAYRPIELEFLARYHLEYDPDDIILRMDGR